MRLIGGLVLVLGTSGASLTSCTVQEADDDDAAPACGDGKVNGDDECDGTKFAGRSCLTEGFEAGEVSCSSDCRIVAAACVILDEDQDQLNIYDEQAAGSDPLNPDTDDDGVLDGVEWFAGADPTNMFSWPQGTGTWPWRTDAAQEALAGQPTGWGKVGEVLKNHPWTDQFGQYVELHQFYGYVIVLSVGAAWCGPCRQAASSSQHLWDQHRDQGVIFLEFLVDGNVQGVDATDADIQQWANQYGLQFPVMRADYSLITASSLPTFYVLNRNMVVTDKQEGFGGDAAISQAINAALASTP